MDKKHSQSGQVVLVTLLVLSVATTIALAMASRTTTDVKISTQVEDSSRAFSAAEAGIEEGLRTGTAITDAPIGASGVSYTVSPSDLGASENYVFPAVTPEGNTATLWLVDPTTGPPYTPQYTGSYIDLCWQGNMAVVAALYFNDGGTYKVGRLAYDPDIARSGGNEFDYPITSTSGTCGTINGNMQRLSFADFDTNATSDNAIMLRFKPVYGQTQFGVKSSGPLTMIPSQGKIYESCGTVEGTDVTRCLSVQQGYKTPSGLFDYVIYAQSGNFP